MTAPEDSAAPLPSADDLELRLWGMAHDRSSARVTVIVEWGQRQREAGFQRGLREAQLTQPGRGPAWELRGENITGHAAVPTPESLAEQTRRVLRRLPTDETITQWQGTVETIVLMTAEAIDALTALVGGLRHDATHLDELDARSRSTESSPREN